MYALDARTTFAHIQAEATARTCYVVASRALRAIGEASPHYATVARMRAADLRRWMEARAALRADVATMARDRLAYAYALRASGDRYWRHALDR